MTKLIASIFLFLQSILDRIPSRKEALLNEILRIKKEINSLQTKASPWTANDSLIYQSLVNKLSELEKRATNVQ